MIVLKDADMVVDKIKTMDVVQKALMLDGLASRVIIPYIIWLLSL